MSFSISTKAFTSSLAAAQESASDFLVNPGNSSIADLESDTTAAPSLFISDTMKVDSVMPVSYSSVADTFSDSAGQSPAEEDTNPINTTTTPSITMTMTPSILNIIDQESPTIFTPPSKAPTALLTSTSHSFAPSQMAEVTTAAPSQSAALSSSSAGSGFPSLEFGDINLVVLTDVHSWVGGHGNKEAYLNADYGHVLSFYQHLKEYCLSTDKDLWFVMNGDWIDGTGLAMNGDPSHLVQIIQKMPYDAVNVGNHELYRTSVLDYVLRPGGFVEWWGDRYISSNIVVRSKSNLLNEDVEMKDENYDQDPPMGSRYRMLHGRHSHVLVFGFLYNMIDQSDVVFVKEVQQVVEETWFAEALLTEKFDAIVVLSHMDVRDSLVEVIIDKIRATAGNENIPVLFVTGHTHKRDVAAVDHASLSFEAGRFLDTIGFISIPNKSTLSEYIADHEDIREGVTGRNANATTRLFQYKFLDASINVLKNTLNLKPDYEFDTDDGIALSNFINRTQTEMGLHEVISCVDDTYYINRSLDDEYSLWRFFNKNVVVSQFNVNDVLFMGQLSWRYDLMGGGNVRLDDVIAVSPFNETFFAISNLSANVLIALNHSLNNESAAFPLLSILPRTIMASPRPIVAESSATELPVNLTQDLNTSSLVMSASPTEAPIELFATESPNGTVVTQTTSASTSTESSTSHTSLMRNYTIIVNEFALPSLREKLVLIFPEASDIEPVPLDKTTTSIWINYLQNDYPGCKISDTANNTTPGLYSHSQSGGGIDHADALRLGFALAAVVLVIASAIVFVRQRSVQFHRITAEREHITDSAFREYVGDYDGNDEEGEFVRGMIA